MALVEEPSVLRRFIRLLQEPFSRIKERWLHYFNQLAMDEDPFDVESQTEQDQIAEPEREKVSADASKQEDGMGVRDDEPAEKPKLQTEKPTSSVPASAHHPKMMCRITMTAIGTTAGLGHLWRLPNMAYKMGTGHFILLYSLLTLIFGLPLYFLSLSCGQYTSQSVVKVFKAVPILQGVGTSMILYTYITGVYQMQMVGLGIHYFLSSFQFNLPWTQCEGQYGSLCLEAGNYLKSGRITVNCVNGSTVADYNNLCNAEDEKYKSDFIQECCGNSLKEQNISSSNLSNHQINPSNIIFHECEANLQVNNCHPLITPSVLFWNRSVAAPLSTSDKTDRVLEIPNLKLLMCSFGAMALVFATSLFGLRRIIYLSVIITPFLFLAFLILILATVSITGSNYGLLKLIKLDFHSFWDADIWYAAIEHCLYSLGLGTCLVVSIGAISPFHNATHKTAFVATITVLLANLLTTILVFSLCEAIASEWNQPFNSVFNAGLGTAYVVFSQALAQLPLPKLCSSIFFALVVLASTCLVSGLMSSITLSLSELFNFSARDANFLDFVLVFSCFLLEIPMHILGGVTIIEAMDSMGIAYSGPIIVTLIIIIIFIYGFEVFCKDLEFMLRFNPKKWLLPVFITFPIMTAVVAILKFHRYQVFEWNIYAIIVGYGCFILILSPILIVFVIKLILLFTKNSYPAPTLEPKLKKHKRRRAEFKSNNTNV